MGLEYVPPQTDPPLSTTPGRFSAVRPGSPRQVVSGIYTPWEPFAGKKHVGCLGLVTPRCLAGGSSPLAEGGPPAVLGSLGRWIRVSKQLPFFNSGLRVDGTITKRWFIWTPIGKTSWGVCHLL